MTRGMTRGRALVLVVSVALPGLAGGACRDRGTDSSAARESPEVIAPIPSRSDEHTDEKPGFIAALTPAESGDVTAPYTSASATVLV
ncbi:MAG: hypothetical protein ACREBE_23930, partial [bacterium]